MEREIERETQKEREGVRMICLPSVLSSEPSRSHQPDLQLVAGLKLTDARFADSKSIRLQFK